LADRHAGTAVVNGFIALFTRDLTAARRYHDLARSLGPNDDEIRPACRHQQRRTWSQSCNDSAAGDRRHER